MYSQMTSDQEHTLSESNGQSSDETTENAGQRFKQTTHSAAPGQSSQTRGLSKKNQEEHRQLKAHHRDQE